jgi:hypothetical protein
VSIRLRDIVKREREKKNSTDVLGSVLGRLDRFDAMGPRSHGGWGVYAFFFNTTLLQEILDSMEEGNILNLRFI